MTDGIRRWAVRSCVNGGDTMTSSSDEFIADPTDHMLAVIDDSAGAEDTAKALRAGGFEEVRLYRGRTGAEAIDSTGQEHGGVGEDVRTVQAALHTPDTLAA